MSEVARAREVQGRVVLQRRMGDSLLRSGQPDEADIAYRKALGLLDDVLRGFPESPYDLHGRLIALSPQEAAEAAELWGERGGILRRRSEWESSLTSYTRGAAFEEVFDLPATYNRVNALKLSLITGRTVSDLADGLAKVRRILEERLGADERAADDAWLWADLGDVRLLLGDLEGAITAYRTFISKARTDSPGLTLSVLRDVIEGMERNGDPDVGILHASAERVEKALTA